MVFMLREMGGGQLRAGKSLRIGSLAKLVAATCMLSIPAQQVPAAVGQQADSEQRKWNRTQLLDLAARVVRSGPELARIWPGYWPEDQSFIFYLEDSGALLITTGSAPAGYQPVGNAVPSDLRGRAYWRPGNLPDVKRPFVTGYPIGGGATAMLVTAGSSTEEDLLALLLHEQFHHYQQTAFESPPTGQFVSPTAVQDRVAFAATAEVERRLLAQAIGTEDSEARRDLLRTYFAVRREREDTLPEEVVRIEKAFELTEGTARYVEKTAHTILAESEEAPGIRELLIRNLRNSLASGSQPFATQWFRRRSYSTGAALTYLLGQSGTADWRRQLEGGTPPDELLESIVGKVAADQRESLAAAALESFGYPAIHAELQPEISTAEKAEIKTVEEFRSLAPYRLVLDASAGARGNTGFKGRNMTQLGPATVALPDPELFNYAAPSVSLVVRERPVLMEVGEGRYTVLLSSHAEFQNLVRAIGSSTMADALEVEAGGIQLKIDRPVTVTVSEEEVLVRVSETDGGGSSGTP